MSQLTIEVKVFNHTNEDFELEHKHLEHGEWINKPESIEEGHEGNFMIKSDMCYGIEGYVTWEGKKCCGERHRDEFTISINKPFHGTTRFSVDCPDRFRYDISGDPLEKHAQVSVSFYELEVDECH